jgi:hypothetical protein
MKTHPVIYPSYVNLIDRAEIDAIFSRGLRGHLEDRRDLRNDVEPLDRVASGVRITKNRLTLGPR